MYVFKDSRFIRWWEKWTVSQGVMQDFWFEGENEGGGSDILYLSHLMCIESKDPKLNKYCKQSGHRSVLLSPCILYHIQLHVYAYVHIIIVAISWGVGRETCCLGGYPLPPLFETLTQRCTCNHSPYIEFGASLKRIPCRIEMSRDI